MQTRSKELVLRLGLGEGEAEDECVCGSAGPLTSGLHYKRKALRGSAELSSKHKGVAVAPARSLPYRVSGDTPECDPEKLCMGVGCEAQIK